jgi:hypothetical protein
MNKIKSYEEFVNEEISLKNMAAGALLATGLAFSNPNTASANEPVKTELSTSSSIDYSELVKVDSTYKKFSIYQKLLVELRSINGVRILGSSADKIVCSVTLTSKPDNSNGQTNATLEIYIKDGEYKAEFKGVNFIYIGTQPVTQGDQFKRELKSTAGQVLTGAIVRGTGNSPIGNMIGQKVTDVTRNTPKQYKNFTYQEAKNGGDSNYVYKVDSEMQTLIQSLKSGF